MKRFPRSAAEWASEVDDKDHGGRPGLADAFAAGAYPSLLKRMGEEGNYVLYERRRLRVGMLHNTVEYIIMFVAVAGAAVLFSGRTLRIDFDFDARIALPVASIGFVLAIAGLLLLHVAWLRPSAARSAEAIMAAILTAVSGAIAIALIPMKAADWYMEYWQLHLVPAGAAAVLGIVSLILQLRLGVGSVHVNADTPYREALAQQWEQLPEKLRADLVRDRDDALHILADRRLLSAARAEPNIGSPFGAATAPVKNEL